MCYSLSSIPADKHEFADAVCQSLYEGSIARKKGGFIEPECIYADGTESPNGEKYAAERFPASWKVHFDFGRGVVHRVTILLPE
jgi:hypothetical protein